MFNCNMNNYYGFNSEASSSIASKPYQSGKNTHVVVERFL